MSALLSQVGGNLRRADWAVRIRVAAAQSIPTQDLPSRLQRMRDRAEILLDNVFRPMTVPATGGFFSAILVFVLVLQLIAPGITVQAVPQALPLRIPPPGHLNY